MTARTMLMCGPRGVAAVVRIVDITSIRGRAVSLRSTETRMVCRNTLALVLVVGTQVIAAAQTASTRAKDLYERAIELERRGNAPAALSLLWEAGGLAPGDGAIQDHLGEA